ncbi:hypothetical protein NQ317_017859 [Molorchus minor]|uniref:Uncharacterized protein n=1 Tax=Molorchus minor TaxID=1323400 RepID=A0ABQ9K0Y4_9CUCU|nr:hypothetical protein NQ317_017859 [Molorchus minor]
MPLSFTPPSFTIIDAFEMVGYNLTTFYKLHQNDLKTVSTILQSTVDRMKEPLKYQAPQAYEKPSSFSNFFAGVSVAIIDLPYASPFLLFSVQLRNCSVTRISVV